MKKHEQIALNRLRLVSTKVSSEIDTSFRSKTDIVRKSIFLAELMDMGFKVENHEAFTGSSLSDYKETIKCLKEMRGGDVDYVPLFSGFPNKVPDIEKYRSSMIDWLGGYVGLFEEEPGCHILSNGTVIPSWLADEDAFGALSFGEYEESLNKKAVANQKARKGDSHVEWITLRFASEDEVEAQAKLWLANNLYAKSSIKEALKPDLEYLIDYFDVNFIDAKRVSFKETKAYIMSYLWTKQNWFGLSKFIDTPTDILRMFAALTNSDVSLSEKITFPKLKRPQRRFVLGTLDRFGPSLAENLNDYRGLWISLARGLHPGEHATKFKNSFNAFNAIQNEKVPSFEGKVDLALKEKKLKKALELLETRPGVFARRLHEVLDTFDEKPSIFKSFEKVADKNQLKNLLVLESYFKTTNLFDTRSIINKKGKIIVIPNDKNRTKAKTNEKVVNIIESAIMKKMTDEAEDFSDKKCWVDPLLAGFTIPLQQRKMSDGLLSFGRGSRIKFDNTKILRLFTYWHEESVRTDLDLSLIQYDQNMNFISHVSYTRLSGAGISHSGDIMSAPNGASEFIDIDFSKIDKNTFYIAPQIYRYSGESFLGLKKSYAGWMVRDKASKNRKTFDIKTVKHKFNMVGKGAYAIPMVVDVQNQEIIYTDIYVKGIESCNRVEGAINNISTITQAVANMVNTRPNMYDLVSRRLEAGNAQFVDNKEEADITYGIENCDFTVDRVEEILSNML